MEEGAGERVRSVQELARKERQNLVSTTLDSLASLRQHLITSLTGLREQAQPPISRVMAAQATLEGDARLAFGQSQMQWKNGKVSNWERTLGESEWVRADGEKLQSECLAPSASPSWLPPLTPHFHLQFSPTTQLMLKLEMAPMVIRGYSYHSKFHSQPKSSSTTMSANGHLRKASPSMQRHPHEHSPLLTDMGQSRNHVASLSLLPPLPPLGGRAVSSLDTGPLEDKVAEQTREKSPRPALERGRMPSGRSTGAYPHPSLRQISLAEHSRNLAMGGRSKSTIMRRPPSNGPGPMKLLESDMQRGGTQSATPLRSADFSPSLRLQPAFQPPQLATRMPPGANPAFRTDAPNHPPAGSAINFTPLQNDASAPDPFDLAPSRSWMRQLDKSSWMGAAAQQA